MCFNLIDFYQYFEQNKNRYKFTNKISRISYREKAAVDQWLETPKHFHFMHDHPLQQAEVLGGMWGASLGRRGIHKTPLKIVFIYI